MQKDTSHTSPTPCDPQPASDTPRATTGASIPTVQMPPEQGVRVGPPMVTRREFAAAAAATATLAALAGSRQAFADASGDQSAAALGAANEESGIAGDGVEELDEEPETNTEPDPVVEIETVDAAGNVHILNTYEDLIDEVEFTPVASYKIPVGSNVFVDCEQRAAVLQANTGSRPLTVIGCLDLTTGAYDVVLPEPVTGAGYAPSDVRASENLLVWVEMNNATEDWAFYAVPFNGQPVHVGSPGLMKLGEGNSEWLPPQFAVWGNAVVWQVMPDPLGPYMTHNSHCYLWSMGSGEASEVWSSPGRFSCPPNITDGVLTIAPRVNPTEGVYYAITALDMFHGLEVIDQLVMPIAVKPFFATRVGNNFAFSVEANYGYGGRLGNMGYYIGPGSGPFDYVSREPSAQVNYTNGYYIVKSQLSYFVIDMARKTYARIPAASGCVDYGDYPATQGVVRRFVTFAAVKDSSTGIPDHVLVRIYSLA